MAEFAGLFEGASASEQVSGIFDQTAVALGIGGSTSAPSGGGTPAASGAWSFDRDQINHLIGKWEDLLDDCKKDREVLQDLRGGEPELSRDDPSTKYASLVLDGIGSIRQSNISMIKYIEDFVEKLKAARDGIQRTEDSNADPFQAVKSVFG